MAYGRSPPRDHDAAGAGVSRAAAAAHDPVAGGGGRAVLLAAGGAVPLPRARSRRRELLLYSMLSRGWVQAFSGLWLGLMAMRTALRIPRRSLAAGLLAMICSSSWRQLPGLLKLAVGDRLPARARAAVMPAAARGGRRGGVRLLPAGRRRSGSGDAVGEAFASRGRCASPCCPRGRSRRSFAARARGGRRWRGRGLSWRWSLARGGGVHGVGGGLPRAVAGLQRQAVRAACGGCGAGADGLAPPRRPAKRRSCPFPRSRSWAPPRRSPGGRGSSWGAGCGRCGALLFTAVDGVLLRHRHAGRSGRDPATAASWGRRWWCWWSSFPCWAAAGSPSTFAGTWSGWRTCARSPCRPRPWPWAQVFTAAADHRRW